MGVGLVIAARVRDGRSVGRYPQSDPMPWDNSSESPGSRFRKPQEQDSSRHTQTCSPVPTCNIITLSTRLFPFAEQQEYLICTKLKILFTALGTVISIQENKIKLDSNRGDRDGESALPFEAEALNAAASNWLRKRRRKIKAVMQAAGLKNTSERKKRGTCTFLLTFKKLPKPAKQRKRKNVTDLTKRAAFSSLLPEILKYHYPTLHRDTKPSMTCRKPSLQFSVFPAMSCIYRFPSDCLCGKSLVTNDCPCVWFNSSYAAPGVANS